MTDDSFTPEHDDHNGDDTMLIYKGKELTSPREIGEAAHKLLDSFDRDHKKSHEALHAMILDFGRMLRAGRALFQGDDIGFGQWVKDYRLDSGKLGGNQRERHACMQIAELHDDGGKPDEENAIPRKLHFTGCNYSTPTDIMKWVRKTQREMLGLPPPKKKPKKGKKKGKPGEGVDLPEDDVGDLGVGNDPLIDGLAAEIKRLRQENTGLREENAWLRERLGLPAESEMEPL